MLTGPQDRLNILSYARLVALSVVFCIIGFKEISSCQAAEPAQEIFIW
jgi:hypothetical protein